jgi:hypothetical protein
MSAFHPLLTLAHSATLPWMRCYYVLVQGKLEWLAGRSACDELGSTNVWGLCICDQLHRPAKQL